MSLISVEYVFDGTRGALMNPPANRRSVVALISERHEIGFERHGMIFERHEENTWFIV